MWWDCAKNQHHNNLWVGSLWAGCWVGTMLRGCWCDGIAPKTNITTSCEWAVCGQNVEWAQCWEDVDVMGLRQKPTSQQFVSRQFVGRMLSGHNVERMLMIWLYQQSLNIMPTQHFTHKLPTQNLWFWLLDIIRSRQHPLNIVPTQLSIHKLPTHNLFWCWFLAQLDHINILSTLCPLNILPTYCPLTTCFDVGFWHNQNISTSSQHCAHSIFYPHTAHSQLVVMLVFGAIRSYQHPLNIVPTQHSIHKLPTHNLWCWLLGTIISYQHPSNIFTTSSPRTIKTCPMEKLLISCGAGYYVG